MFFFSVSNGQSNAKKNKTTIFLPVPVKDSSVLLITVQLSIPTLSSPAQRVVFVSSKQGVLVGSFLPDRWEAKSSF